MNGENEKCVQDIRQKTTRDWTAWETWAIRAIIALTMEAASTSEPSVNFYQTTRDNISEDSGLHTRRRKNLKSHQFNTSLLTAQSGNQAGYMII
jgi:hypothetical protein